jgi:tRNA(adenine34) deaminase
VFIYNLRNYKKIVLIVTQANLPDMQYELYSDEYFMNEALKEAHNAFARHEIPVGAVIVADNRIITRAFNMSETLNDATAHAELLAITSASNTLGTKFLTGAILYVTVEPCTMCAGACYWARLHRIVYGVSDPKAGFTKTGIRIIHPTTKVVSGILEKECKKLMKDFFNLKR